jgi:beta-N-acetylhexosaminidase
VSFFPARPDRASVVVVGGAWVVAGLFGALVSAAVVHARVTPMSPSALDDAPVFAAPPPARPTDQDERAHRSVDDIDVDALLARMTLEQKVGQLLMIGFGGTEVDGTVARLLDESKAGGVALFSRNIVSPTQTAALVRGVRAHDPRVGGVRIPTFVAVDQEGGNVVRLKSMATVLPTAMALGATDDATLARRVGQALGRDLVAWGFNMNLAPVLDVNSNPKNPVIGTRSFGADPERVAALGAGYIRGLADEGIVAVAKHFPGHGDTDVDSHYGLPVLSHDRARLDAVELLPFTRAFSAGLPAMMTAHIALPQIAEAKDVPATVSRRVLTDLVRHELRWDGLIITDGLEMRGVVEHYGTGEAAVQAVVAGADMVMVLWSPQAKKAVRRALLEASRSGRIPPARLDEAVRRVLSAKARAGLFTRPVVQPAAAARTLAKNDRSAVVEVAQRAITIVRDRSEVLPLKKGARVVAASPLGGFLDVLGREWGATTVSLPWAPTPERTRDDAARVAALAQGADVVVIGVLNGDHAPVVRAAQAALRRRGSKASVVVVSFGSPWVVDAFRDVDGYVCAFGWRDDSARAAARVLTGSLPPRGRLPVHLNTEVPARTAAATTTATTATASTSSAAAGALPGGRGAP